MPRKTAGKKIGKRENLIEKIKERLEEARILSTKEPMQLSDRVNLNSLIRSVQEYMEEFQ